MKEKQELELYIHIPFCVRKCSYCDFLSAPADEDVIQKYVEALLREICDSQAEYGSCRVTSVFFGGGTPSLLEPPQVQDILQALHESFQIDPDAEISVEANPKTVTKEKLRAWKEGGTNRISLGLQSCNDTELKMLGRIHTFRDFLETWSLIRDAGFSNANLDLISAIPGQTLESWKETLCRGAELEPEHISAYSLIIEEGTPFARWYKTGTPPAFLPPLPDEEEERRIYVETEEVLEHYGFHRYEISNYAKPGKECRHNVGYWTRKPYLGLGLGASSLMDNIRFKNPTDLKEYIRLAKGRLPHRMEEERLTKEDCMEEFMFLGLRLKKGISKQEFLLQFGKPVEEIYGEPLHMLEKYGLIREEGGRIRLTSRGTDLSNYVFEQFLL